MLRFLLDEVSVDPNAEHGREQQAALHAAAKSGDVIPSLNV